MIRRLLRMAFAARHLTDNVPRSPALVVAGDAGRGRLGRFERHDGRDVRRVERGEVQVEEFGGLPRDVGGEARATLGSFGRPGLDPLDTWQRTELEIVFGKGLPAASAGS